MGSQMNATTKLTKLKEPSLLFSEGQRLSDPKIGLSIFGPVDKENPSHPRNISYGVIGTRSGIDLVKNFMKLINGPVVSPYYYRNGEKLWQPFPGFSVAFDSTLPYNPTKIFEIDEVKLNEAAMDLNPNKRAYEVVNLFLEGVNHLQELDEKYDVILCIVPETVFLNCRPKSSLSFGVGEKVPISVRKERARTIVDVFGVRNDMYRYSVDFRRQIKARAMEVKNPVPIQILRESTLETHEDPDAKFGSTKSPISDRAWNISTALYFKAGGKPWKLDTAREGVCYLGIVFRRLDPTIGDQTACSAALMFLDSGDGNVVRGDFGPWYSPKNEQYHLSKNAAKSLLEKVLLTYQNLEGKPLKEIFLHYRAWINKDEYEGFQLACPPGVKLVCVRVHQEKKEVRLYREGTKPVIRGTLLKVNDRRCYLFSSGFKPFLGTYDGWETPAPLRIDIQHGEAEIGQVAKDILGLTKLNFNECKFGDSDPVTIGFSDAVGEILVSNPDIKEADPRFKFYI